MTAQQRTGLAPLAVDMVRRYHEDSRDSAELDPVFRKLLSMIFRLRLCS